MVFICTSMYYEASPFIKQLNLKKEPLHHKFQIFKNEDTVLVITGVGKVLSAIAVTYLFLKYEPSPSDIFINIGICGAKDKNMRIGEAYICSKIIENETQKTFYPDMIIKTPFREGSIETFSSVTGIGDFDIHGELVDMESSGIYQGASVFIQPHQIFFIKIVSDYLEGEGFEPLKVSKLIEDRSSEIMLWINEIKNSLIYEKDIINEEEQEIINIAVENLKLSVTMENQFKQLIRYYKLQGGDFKDIVAKYAYMECESRNEGKRYFAELKRELI